VYARLGLRGLAEGCAKAFRSGEIAVSVAGFLSRMPNPKHQTAVLDWVRQQVAALRNPTSTEIRDYIAREYHLDLDDAPFDIADAALVEAAGACTACPKRTGNQKLLYADVEKGDTCTDALCFKGKSEASWKARADEAEAAGMRVLSASASKKVFAYGNSVGNGWVGLDEKATADPKKRTWRRILGKGGEAAAALARDPRGHAREVIEEPKAFEIAIENGHDWAKKEQRAGRVNDADPKTAEDVRAKTEAKRKADRELAEELVKRVVAAARDIGPNDLVLRLAVFEAAGTDPDEADRVLEAAGVKPDPKVGGARQLGKLVAKLNVHGLTAMLIQLLIGHQATAFNGPEELRAIAKDFGIDWKEVQREMKAASVEESMAEAVDPDEIEPKAKKRKAVK
jgi:hypothetical protein